MSYTTKNTKLLKSGFVQSALVLWLVSAFPLSCQPLDGEQKPGVAPSEPSVHTASKPLPDNYRLAADDEITTRSLTAKEISDKTFRIDQAGEVNFPLVGRVSLAGKTQRQAETAIQQRLAKFYVTPDVELDVSSRHSEPVSVIGAVGTPGVQQIRTRATLLEVLSTAGGIRTDAGPVVRVIRANDEGSIPHPGAHSVGPDTSVVEINLKNLLDVKDPTDDIVIRPHDVVAVPPAEIVYVVGDVKRAGGFPLGGKSNLSVLQALALAEGLDPRAAPKRAKILRRGQGGNQSQEMIPVDVEKILSGKATDVQLLANDILFIPNSTAKSVTARSIEMALQVGTGLAIWRL